MTMNLHSELVSSRELRRAPRLEFGHRAWCEYREITLYLPVVNVSRGGLFLHTSTPLAVGERLKVSVLPGAGGIALEAEITWSRRRGRGAGVGCRIVSFLDGAERYAALLEHLRRGTFEGGMPALQDCSLSAFSR
jgi:hypothetical protein